MQGLFITGTDTGVGKTWTACALIRLGLAAGIRIGAYKPVCSGAVPRADGSLHWDDLDALGEALPDVPAELIGPQRFLAPLAPPTSAAAEGREVNYSQVLQGVADWRDRCDLLIVEGAGGFCCPLTEELTFADLAVALGFPVLVVAANRLGVINHTLLTLESIRSRRLPVAGVVLNNIAAHTELSAATNLEGLRRHSQLTWMGQIHHGESTIQTRDGRFGGIDLIELARRTASG